MPRQRKHVRAADNQEVVELAEEADQENAPMIVGDNFAVQEVSPEPLQG